MRSLQFIVYFQMLTYILWNQEVHEVRNSIDNLTRKCVTFHYTQTNIHNLLWKTSSLLPEAQYFLFVTFFLTLSFFSFLVKTRTLLPTVNRTSTQRHTINIQQPHRSRYTGRHETSGHVKCVCVQLHGVHIDIVPHYILHQQITDLTETKLKFQEVFR